MKRKNPIFAKSFTILILLLLTYSAQAATVTWLGGTGSWNEPSHWDTGSIPTSSDDVVIPSGRVEILNNEVFSVTNIEVQSAGQLYVHDGSVLHIADAVGKDGLHNMGEVSIAGDLSVSNTTSINLFGPGKGILNEAYFHIASTGNLSMESTDIAAIDNVSPGQFDNHGTIVIYDIDGHGIKTNHQFRNHGTINITANTINPSYGILNSGDFSNVAGGMISIYGGGKASFGNHNFGTACTLQNHGNIEVSNSNSIGFNNSGSINNYSSGLLSSSNSYSNGFYNQLAGTITNHGIMESHYDNIGIFNLGQIQNHSFVSLFNSTATACQAYAGSQFDNHGNYYAYSIGIYDLFIDGTFNNDDDGIVNINQQIFVTPSGNLTNNGFLNSNYNGNHLKSAGGVLVNYGAVGDRFSGFQISMDNQQVIVETLNNPMYDGVPYPNALDVFALNNVTVLGWFTNSFSNISAGTYDSQNNEFTPNANAVGLNILYIHFEINGSGNRMYYPVVASGGILP